MRFSIAAAILLISACGGASTGGHQQGLRSQGYGKATRVRGGMLLGMETSTFTPCTTLTGTCKIDERYDWSQGCWIDMADGARLPTLSDGHYSAEVTGQIAISDSPRFGHMNMFRCQVRILQLHSLYEGNITIPGEVLGRQIIPSER